MKARGLLLLLSVAALCTFAGCGGGDGGGGSSSYKDGFDDNSGKWPDASSQETRRFVLEGKYFIAFLQPERLAASAPADLFGGEGTVENALEDSEQKVEADARQGEISVGLLCRWNGETDAMQGYILALVHTSRGKRAVIYNATGSFPPDTVKASSEDIEFRGTNDVEASCEGDKLVLKVNGKEVVSGEDSTHRSGQNGIFAARLTDTPGQAVAAFDNYETTR